MYKDHRTFSTPPSDALLWRYMDFTKFVSLLEQRALFFAKVSRLGDPFDGSITKFTLSESLWKRLSNPEILRDELRRYRERNLISCWNESAYESAAMWKLYGQHIAVRTTSARLCRSFVCKEDVYVGKVRYVDYEADHISFNNIFNLYLHKRRGFEHEQEVRAVISVGDGDTADWAGQYYDVDVEVLVEQVVVAPFAAGWFFDLVRAVAEKYGLGAPVEKSALEVTPTFLS